MYPRPRISTKMIGGYGLGPEGCGFLSRLPAEVRPTRLVGSVSSLIAQRNKFDVVIVVATSEGQFHESGAVQLLRVAFPPRVFLVAPLTPSVARAVATDDPRHEKVVWYQEASKELPRRLEVADRKDLLLWCHEGVSRRPHVSPIARAGIRRACVTVPPPTTVAELCELIGVPQRTFRHHWRESFLITPRDFLRWVLLVRGAQREMPNTHAVGAWLGLDYRTVDRAVIELLGGGARWDTQARSGVRDQFEEWTRQHLFTRDLPSPD